ncbi:formiminotransferase N-terminal subdomain-containing protein isoform X1 [Lampetra planeri]
MPRPLRLAASLLNVSGARDPKVVEAVAWAALRTPHGRLFPNATVLNVFADPEYNRSVITVVAPVETLGESLVSACVRACALIDVSAHSGGHPCLGSVDLVPVHPLSDSVGLHECGRVAQAMARELTLQVPGASAFLFGWADEPGRRSLVSRRREWAWYGGPGQTAGEVTPPIPDVGPMPGPRYGIAGVGATPYVMNCNVTIDSTDLRLGRRIARALRASSPGGLPGVEAMAFPHEGRVEVACNVRRFDPLQLRVHGAGAGGGARAGAGGGRRRGAGGHGTRGLHAGPLPPPGRGGHRRRRARLLAAARGAPRVKPPACFPAAPKVYSDCRGRRTLLQSATVLKAQPRNCSLKRRRKGLHEGDLLSVFGLLFHAGGSGSTRSPHVTCRSTVCKLYPETKSTCTLTQRTLT